MRKSIVFFVLVFLFTAFFSQTVFAEERYAVKNPDGSVRILVYQGGIKDSFDDFLKSVGAYGLPIIAISNSEDSDKKDRDYWTLVNGHLTIDQFKKQADIDAKAAKKAKKDAVLSKLKITEQEFEELMGSYQ